MSKSSAEMQATSYLYGSNGTYIADLYERYVQNPSSVDSEWIDLFQMLDGQSADALTDLKGACDSRVVAGGELSPQQQLILDLLRGAMDSPPPAANTNSTSPSISPSTSPMDMQTPTDNRQAVVDTARAMLFIRSYRLFGHFKANLDPLGICEAHSGYEDELNPETYGFNLKTDMDRPIFLNHSLGMEYATLREIIEACEKIYCGTIGVEYLHILDKNEKDWFKAQMEEYGTLGILDKAKRQRTLRRLARADMFEQFLDKKWRGTKRFGLDGGESTIPLLDEIIGYSGERGLETAIIGMAHRGRLNVLCNVMQKPYTALFNEFMGGKGSQSEPEDVAWSGDVKYHLGASADRKFSKSTVHLSLVPNPSHLEAVNTVVLGRVAARQGITNDTEHTKVMGILLHGDAAFIGQGIVAETFLLSQLDGYKTGGTIHVVTNNQIGFTTKPSKSRSSPYCSDMAKMIDAPVIHVNGDDVESCIFAARLAAEYRLRFKKDVVIDMWCYRRHGHNEGDEPSFTQPIMYAKIKHQTPVLEKYAQFLLDRGDITPSEWQQMQDTLNKTFEDAYNQAGTYKANHTDWLAGGWSGLKVAPPKDEIRRGETCINKDVFEEIADGLTTIPNRFNLHSKIKRRVKQLRQMYDDEIGIDWGAAEAMAFGSLTLESNAVRLSGEDCERGTFSHRHSVWNDQKTEEKYIPLNNLRSGQANFDVLDSPLSEYGVLGFEYGYAMENPHSLVLWEAQFGDFANGAQIMIDQFIASGEIKWLRMNGLVMLLPHGFEGQGPEHSSARLERYLQLSAQDNWQVCNVTTPANYFHILRRQMKRNFRKPLILMTPKSLLRHKVCVSKKDDFLDDTFFHRYFMDSAKDMPLAKRKQIKRLVFCSGKVYYDLLAYQTAHKRDDVILIRIEQLYPFPQNGLSRDLRGFENAHIIWCQEEPQNNGAWSYIDRILEDTCADAGIKNNRPKFVGRKSAASPATGHFATHTEQQQQLIEQAFSL